MLAFVNAGLLQGANNVPSLSYLPPSIVSKPSPPLQVSPSNVVPAVNCPGYENVVNPAYIPPRCLPNRIQPVQPEPLPSVSDFVVVRPGYGDPGHDSTNNGNWI